MIFRQLFDRSSCTYTYLLADEESRLAVLIDPVLELVERDLQILAELRLSLRYTIETHLHADHITGGAKIRAALGSECVVAHAAGDTLADRKVHHGDEIRFGAHTLEVRCTPGHTNGCASYVDHHGRRVFTGDALMVRGCGRTDFQQGSPETLFASVHEQIFSLPGDYAIYPGHDYRGRTSSTVEEERQHNPRLGNGRSLMEFRQIMGALNLSHPAKIDVAVPANRRCGLLVEDAGGASSRDSATP
ncbi:MAG TPA: hypothetical protein DFR83_16140 [Deltaproteobacteria bacterium]|nr:hypothetical protein [Deltaproteobacteria bacterium]